MHKATDVLVFDVFVIISATTMWYSKLYTPHKDHVKNRDDIRIDIYKSSPIGPSSSSRAG